MATMAREAWTDERLDDLNHRVDEGFKEMREEFRAVRAESKAEFASVRREFESVRGEANSFRSEVSQQFAAQQRMMNHLFMTMMVGFLGVIATILTQT